MPVTVEFFKTIPSTFIELILLQEPIKYLVKQDRYVREGIKDEATLEVLSAEYLDIALINMIF